MLFRSRIQPIGSGVRRQQHRHTGVDKRDARGRVSGQDGKRRDDHVVMILMTEKVYKRPVFVTDYPKEIKAFYMKQNQDGKTVAAADCLVPGIGEIIGGSQREDDLDKLTKRMEELDMNMNEYQFYLDLRRYGSVRHAGFGLGFERCVMYLTGMSNIRDVELFPRTVGNCEL